MSKTIFAEIFISLLDEHSYKKYEILLTFGINVIKPNSSARNISYHSFTYDLITISTLHDLVNLRSSHLKCYSCSPICLGIISYHHAKYRGYFVNIHIYVYDKPRFVIKS